MLFHEAVYTSAPALLEGPSGSDLGIVVKSRQFPVGLERDLAGQQYYSLLPDISVHDVQAHPPRLVVARRGARGEYFCVSRAVFAGADHTGRTTPLVHHLVFALEDMVAERVSPAAVLASTHQVLYQEWKQPPTWVDPRRTLSTPPSPEQLSEFPHAAWERLLGQKPVGPVLSRAAECLLAFCETRKPLVFCLPVAMGHITYRLMADLLTLIPQEIQFQCGCASHVIQSCDCPENSVILFTYPGTSFLARQASRVDEKAPILFDLVTADSALTGPLGKYGAALSGILQSRPCAEQLSLARDCVMVLKSGPDGQAFFPTLWKLYGDFRKVKGIPELHVLAAQTARAIECSPPLADLAAQWANAMIERWLMRLPAAQRWEAVADIAWDRRWPKLVQSRCLGLIRGNACEALPVFLRRVQPGKPEEQSCRAFVGKVLAAQQHLVMSAVEQAVRTGTPEAVKVAVLLVNASSPRDLDTVPTWVAATLSGSDSVRESLLPAVVDCAYRSTSEHTPAWFDQLAARTGEQLRASSVFRRGFEIPLLRRLLSDNRITRTDWSTFSEYLVDVALREGVPQEEIGWLASENRGRMTEQLQDAWIQRAESIGQAAALTRVMQELGLFRVVAPALAYGCPGYSLPSLPRISAASCGRPTSTGHSLAFLSWTIALCATLVLFEPVGLQKFWPSLIVHDSWISFTLAAAATGGALLFCLIVEMILRIVRLPGRYLRYTRLVRWLVVTAMVGAMALSALRLVEVVGLLSIRAG